jgi:hypothetical protein
VEDYQEKSIVKLDLAGGLEREWSGCRIAGYINVPKVPGNFHLSTHGRNVVPQDIDMQHHVNSLFFSDSPRGMISIEPCHQHTRSCTRESKSVAG